MSDGSNPFLITPPPGLLPPPRETPEEASTATVGGDSATRRIIPPREPVITAPPAVQGIPFSTPPAAPIAAPAAVAPVAVELPAPAPAPAPESAVDDDETRIVPPRAAPAQSWRLALPDGSGFSIGSAVFIGRNPIRADGDIAGDLLAVADTTKSVSKTHAVVEVIDGRLWVTDLNSTNGVFVTAEAMDDVQATPMERTLVPPGSDIELGEFVIQVEQG